MRPPLEHRIQRFHATHGAHTAWKSGPSSVRVQSQSRDHRNSNAYARIKPMIRRASRRHSQHRTPLLPIRVVIPFPFALSSRGSANARPAILPTTLRGCNGRGLVPRQRRRPVARPYRQLPLRPPRRPKPAPVRRTPIRVVMGLRACHPGYVTSGKPSRAPCPRPTTPIQCGQRFQSDGSAAWRSACV